MRDDNPRLLVREPPAARSSAAPAGLAESPTKVTVTGRARLDAGSNFFATGDSEKIVYCASAVGAGGPQPAGAVATVVDGGPDVEVGRLAEDLHDRGVRRLMVEGGGTGAHPVPHRGGRRRAAPGRRPVLRRHLARAAGSSGTAPSRGTPATVRAWRRPGRSATWCCCATRCRPGSTDR